MRISSLAETRTRAVSDASAIMLWILMPLRCDSVHQLPMRSGWADVLLLLVAVATTAALSNDLNENLGRCGGATNVCYSNR